MHMLFNRFALLYSIRCLLCPLYSLSDWDIGMSAAFPASTLQGNCKKKKSPTAFMPKYSTFYSKNIKKLQILSARRYFTKTFGKQR